MKPSNSLPRIWVNAEFQRLLWLNFSWVMLSCIVLIYAMMIYAFAMPPEYQNGAILGIGGMVVSVFAGLVMMLRSLKQDIEHNMFDQIRMSSLSPWQMVYARIIAAPIVAWMVFVMGAFMTLVYLFLHPDVITPRHRFLDSLLFIAYFTSSAWSLYCLFLSNALQLKRGSRQWEGSTIQVILLCIVLGSLTIKRDAIDIFFATHLWISAPWIMAIVMAVFTSIMAYAAMAQILHLRPSKPTFLCLSILAPVVFCGLVSIQANESIIWREALFIYYAWLAAFSLMVQDNRPETLSRLWRAIQNAHWKTALQYLPAWMVLLPVAMVGLMLTGVFAWHLLLLLACVLFFGRLSIPYNSITLSMVMYVVIYAVFNAL